MHETPAVSVQTFVCVFPPAAVSVQTFVCVSPQLPVITDLRNPCLKQRHWDTIENILEYKFTPEDPLTLGRLTDINAFKHAETLQEISGQASSEASLEGILRKVRLQSRRAHFMGVPVEASTLHGCASGG